MITRSIRGLCMLLVLFLVAGSGLQAQIKTTTFNDNVVKENSIVVKYDNTMITAKGKAVSPKTLAADIRTLFNASIGRTLDSSNAEEWLVTGDMNTVLTQLNRIPGVRAFPNYVFYRDELEITQLSSDRIFLGNEQAAQSFLRPSINAEAPVSFITKEADGPIFYDNFDDSTASADMWEVIDHAGENVEWTLQFDGEGYYYGVTNFNDSVSFASTDLYSPAFDMTEFDTNKTYLLSFDIDFWDLTDSTFVGLFFEVTDGSGNWVTDDSFDLTGIFGEVSVDVSGFTGDTMRFSFYVQDEITPIGSTISLVDNVMIEEFATNDPLVSLQYGLNNDGSFNPGYSVEGADVDAFAAWDMTRGDDDVIFVVYDDGVDFSHPDLMDNAWMNPGEIPDNGIDDDENGYIDDVYGWSSVYNDNSFLNSGSFHGTHVAGILGAQGNNGIGVSGVSQDVSIINVMIFNEFGGTDAISIMAGYQYITDLLDAGVPITGINQSWGGGGFLDLESDQQFVSVMTAYALDHAEHAALWIVSAGNDASNRDELPFYSYPNNIQSPNIITVASSDDADLLSGFSDFGEFTVDVTAPGSSILSTVPPSTTGLEYGFLGGTSMAAPHVAGILALAKAMYPDEDGFDLLARLLAGNEDVPSLDGVTGEGGRVNAASTLSPEGTPTSSAPLAHFHRTFVDGDALETVGFVNNSGGPLTVTGMSLTGTDAANFEILTTETPTLAAGESFGFSVAFDNAGVPGDLTATLEVATDGGTVSIGLLGHEQGFGVPFIDPFFADLGAVPYGTELSTSFTLYNDGNGDLLYNLQQALFFLDLEFSVLIDELDRFQPSNSDVDKGPPGDDVEFLDEITARVMLERGDRKLPKIEYQPGMHPTLELDGPEIVFSDSLNDEDEVLANWELLSFGDAENFWGLEDISEVEGDTNNVFLFGDFDVGYINNALPVAIPPAFDFSELDEGRGPAYLVFDAEAELEDGFDDFYINVISNGSRLATIAGTFDGSIPNFGGYNTVWVDITQFAGLDDVEFWFIANSDVSFAAGFGALFDNVHVIVDDLPFFTSTGGGSLAPGESEEIDITIRTELLPPGDFVLYTDVFTNGFISYYGGGPLYHTAVFSARNVSLLVDPFEQWIGEASTEAATEFTFDATNVGTVDVEYIADVFVAYEQPDDFFGDGFVTGKTAALDRFEASEKGEGGAIDLTEHRNLVLDNLSKRTGVASGSSHESDIPRMSPSREDLDIYFEDFETIVLDDTWDIFDFSFGLGNVFDVVDYGTVDFPDNFLNVGGISENGWFIFNDTYTLAFSESFDLSTVPNSDETIMEFTYTFLLEPGYDFASVWIGVETDDGVELYLAGTSEDVLFNNGGLYRTGFDISEFAGLDNVFMAFLVETDQSVQSGWAGFDDLDVYTTEKLAYIDPAEGSIDSAATQTFTVTVNTPWLVPGDYVAISVIDYYNEDLFIGRSAEQFTYFEIPNMKPVAEDDFLAAITDEVIPMDAILGTMLFNDFDVDGFIYLYDVTDPLFGDIKYTFDGWVYVAPEEGGKVDMMQYIITDGQLMDTATVYISIGDNPHFPVGSDQQFVFLEDESLTMNTTGMAAGVGFWDGVFVWAESHNTDLTIGHDSDNHTLTLSATDNAFGQFTATLYVGHVEGDVFDSTDVSVIVTPVNDAPIAGFTTTITGAVVEFIDQSSDAIDLTDGGIVAWDWDFGDGNTSSEMSPVHDYGDTGEFTVTLTVTDNGGLTNTISEPIEILSVSNEENVGVPTEFAIEQNYPNPFNPSTNINYSLPEASKVTIVVYDLLGQKVAELVNTEKAAGYHSIAFDASALSSGLYIYQIRAGAFTQTKKMMLIK